MNEKEILNHCVIVEITKCENKNLWYEDLVGKHLVAFGFDDCEEKVYCCHKDNDAVTMHPLPLEDLVFVKGELDDLYVMD